MAVWLLYSVELDQIQFLLRESSSAVAGRHRMRMALDRSDKVKDDT